MALAREIGIDDQASRDSLLSCKIMLTELHKFIGASKIICPETVDN